MIKSFLKEIKNLVFSGILCTIIHITWSARLEITWPKVTNDLNSKMEN